jgi:hypothetical protein
MFDFSFLLSAFQLFVGLAFNHQPSTPLQWQSPAAAKSCHGHPLGSRGWHESVKSEDRHRHDTGMAPLRARAEAGASGDFSPLRSGQNPNGCKEIAAARLTQELACCS